MGERTANVNLKQVSGRRAVEIAEILAKITWKRLRERAANAQRQIDASVRPAVEIAEILVRNYVKTIQLDLESSGEIPFS